MTITKISPSVVDFDASITISTADNLDTLTLTSTDADASNRPNIKFHRNSGSRADIQLRLPSSVFISPLCATRR